MQALEAPKHKKSLPKYLTLEQSIDLLQAVDGPDKERDYCILTLFLNCGMRLSELVGINLTDIRHQSSCIRIVGKGDKERIVYLNPACWRRSIDIWAVRPKDGVKDKTTLFISRQHKRISPKTVQHIVKKYLGAIDLGGPGYSVHKLRHTAATLMYQHGDVGYSGLKGHPGAMKTWALRKSTTTYPANRWKRPLTPILLLKSNPVRTQNPAETNAENTESEKRKGFIRIRKKQKPLRRKEGSLPLFPAQGVFRLSLFSSYNKNLLINIFTSRPLCGVPSSPS